MSRLTARMHAVGLHRHTAGRPCEFIGHDYPRAAVDRHSTGALQCPECAQPIPDAQPLMNGMLRIPPHDRLSSAYVRVVGR